MTCVYIKPFQNSYDIILDLDKTIQGNYDMIDLDCLYCSQSTTYHLRICFNATISYIPHTLIPHILEFVTPNLPPPHLPDCVSLQAIFNNMLPFMIIMTSF